MRRVAALTHEPVLEAHGIRGEGQARDFAAREERIDELALGGLHGQAPHFAQQLRKWLIAWADRNDYNLYTDGLVVHTTIDSRLQALANQAVTRQGNQLQSIANAAWAPRAGWAENRALVQALRAKGVL